jgi:hypothetical protein
MISQAVVPSTIYYVPSVFFSSKMCCRCSTRALAITSADYQHAVEVKPDLLAAFDHVVEVVEWGGKQLKACL